MEKLVCSNCKGALKWNPSDRTFVCQSCGSAFQADNEFTYRYVDEAELEKIRASERKDKNEFSRDAKNLGLGLLLILGGILLLRLIPFLFLGV